MSQRDDTLKQLEAWQATNDDVDFAGLILLTRAVHASVDAEAVLELIAATGEQLRYSSDDGAPYIYRERGVYERLEEKGVREFLLPILRQLHLEFRQLRALAEGLPAKQAKAIWADVPGSFEMADRLVGGILKTLPQMFEPVGERRALVVNLGNGYLDLGEIKGMAPGGQLALHDPTPDLFTTSQLPFDYEPAASCPNWDAYLADAVPDPTVRDFLQEFVGYLLVPDTQFETALFMIGEGGCGKGTFSTTVRELLGDDNVSDLSLEDLADRFRPADLEGKLLNVCSEVDPKKPIKEDVFKKIVSGERFVAERKYQQNFSLKPYVRWIVASNQYPNVADDSGAFYRRVAMVRFDQVFSDAKPLPRGAKPKNPLLREKLKATELPGIMNWALAGLERLVRHGRLDPPAVVGDVRDAFRAHNDPVAQFLAERCEVDAGDLRREVRKDELYEAFLAWYRATGGDEKGFNQNVFGKKVLDALAAEPAAKGLDREELARRGDVDGKKVGWYRGVALRPRPTGGGVGPGPKRIGRK